MKWPIQQGKPYEMAKAQELLCPGPACAGVELRDVTTRAIGAAQCPRCRVVYVWRLTGGDRP